MICIFVILLTGWCRMRMRPVRLVSYAFLYTTYVPAEKTEIGLYILTRDKTDTEKQKKFCFHQLYLDFFTNLLFLGFRRKSKTFT